MTDLQKYLLRQTSQAIAEHRLIEDGDRILVAVSGGKDSYAMLEILRLLQKRAPIQFDLLAFHLDQGHPGYDGKPLKNWLIEQQYHHHIVHENTYDIVTQKIPEGKTYCSLCSRLRRGVLYSWADKLDCNKIALGHHRDDVIETLLLNLFFSGKMAAMPAKLLSDDHQHVVIRPLIFCSENKLAEYAKERNFPILPCNLCGSQEQAKRKQIKQLLTQLEIDNPTLKANIFAALSRVQPSHLLDKKLFKQNLLNIVDNSILSEKGL